MSSPDKINEFLTSTDPINHDEVKSHHDVLSRKSSHKSKHTTHHNDDGFDYETQEYRGNNNNNNNNIYNNNNNNIRPTTSYIPQYALDGSFPIQEVVPNTQMAIATGSDPKLSGGTSLRPRGATTVSANILHLGDVNSFHAGINSNKSNFDNGPSSPQQGRSNTNFSNNNNSNYNNGSHMNNNTNNNYTSGDEIQGDINDEDDEPMNVPMMVKPKTLYQNPQTPTVLPSTYHPINRWSSVKHSFLKEFLAEFIGTLVLILLGCATCCQVNLGAKIQENAFTAAMDDINNLSDQDESVKKMVLALQDIITNTASGTFDQLPLGWASAVVMGYFVAGGSAISGAHLNPAITVANFVFRGFPAKKVPLYLAGQFIGAFCGALICFILYKKVIIEAFDEWWHAEAMGAMFYTNPKPYLSSSRQFTSEFITTAVFQACVFALTDPYTCLSSEVYPLMLFILIYILNTAMSYQTACAINAARDLGPRLALYAVGFNRGLLWDKYAHYFWVPLVAPFIGSLCGALIYDVCIYQGHESPVNWPLAVYKDMLMKAWFRRPGWKRRNRGRATSDLSDFSFDNDEDMDGNMIDKALSSEDGVDGGILKPTKSRGKTNIKGAYGSNDEDDTDVQRSVSFKPMQRGRRGINGIPTILEEENSIETTSIVGDSGSDSILFSSDASSSLPNFTSTDEKREH
ncbi:similar to Saccharomyces cerevisiae YLL043W FPS1 Plasma membrane channel, member of major intrinsic protein (MIP) family [Maudiozyma saulgeensis]|uniref:Similar to Saccharomyces cerevisiae YLL043W FPS1 Plasma membrane channel, member of major intrinsic protein (MIP) family n=1 Tax=Maudiozyma saulgeensis TaxID=1789683 RepID=A0A1X7R4Q1_9SACH|nr:similar to Saccharomyces cerevisiae YLL043W FPS1 Plasma membrane channel, member of major intrinsic protein (MIP) family [Kazachstania saulgeensis]